MEKFIQMLKEKGTIKNIQNSIDMGYFITESDEGDSSAIKACIMHKVHEDEELQYAFFEGSTDMFLDAVVKELDIKPDKNFKPNELEKQIGKMAILASLFGGINE